VNPGAGTAALLFVSLCLGLLRRNRPARQISPPLRGFLAKQISRACRSCAALRPRGAARPDPRRSDHAKAAMGADLEPPRKDFIMSTIGIFTASSNGYSGTVRTLTLNVKVKLVPNADKERDNAPDFRIVAGSGLEIGAAWKKLSKAERPYLSVTLDDPSFPATIYARLVEGDDGAHNLIWSRSKGD
jgi:uncharacterized protein (DUF736 family)